MIYVHTNDGGFTEKQI